MKNDEIVLIRNKDIENNVKIRQLKNSKKRIIELQNDPKVKEYLELLDFINKETLESIKTRRDYEIDRIVSSTEESNGLLFDYGYIDILIDEDDDPNSYDNEIILLHIYRDLETKEYYCDRDGEIEKLPDSWYVIDSEKESINRKLFIELRKNFIKQLLNANQECVINDLVKNEKVLKKEQK